MRRLSQLFTTLRSKSSWERIYQKYKPHVSRIVKYRMNLSTDEYEDVCNEIMIRIHEQLDKYSSDYSFKTWVTTLTINYCNGYYRKKKREIVDNVVDLNNISIIQNRVVDTPETILIEKEEILKFIEYINNFKEIEYDILYLRYMEGYKYEDISTKLNVNVSKVKNVIRARRDDIEKFAVENLV